MRRRAFECRALTISLPESIREDVLTPQWRFSGRKMKRALQAFDMGADVTALG